MLSYLLFDLDNTLYSQTLGLEGDIGRRITEHAASFLGLSVEETVAVRKPRLGIYGTSLEWLIKDYGYSDIEGYFAAIHPEDEADGLGPDPALGALLDSLALPKAIFTNSPREHAQRVLDKLGVADRFEAIYDIRFNDFQGKPHVSAAQRVCAACGVRPDEALFVDDLPRYVQGFNEAGGLGILLDELDRHPGLPLRRIKSLAELPGILGIPGILGA